MLSRHLFYQIMFTVICSIKSAICSNIICRPFYQIFSAISSIKFFTTICSTKSFLPICFIESVLPILANRFCFIKSALLNSGCLLFYQIFSLNVQSPLFCRLYFNLFCLLINSGRIFFCHFARWKPAKCSEGRWGRPPWRGGCHPRPPKTTFRPAARRTSRVWGTAPWRRWKVMSGRADPSTWPSIG